MEFEEKLIELIKQKELNVEDFMKNFEIRKVQEIEQIGENYQREFRSFVEDWESKFQREKEDFDKERQQLIVSYREECVRLSGDRQREMVEVQISLEQRISEKELVIE